MTLVSNGTVLWRTLVAAARETGDILTAEEATTAGGLGGAVAETVVQHNPK